MYVFLENDEQMMPAQQRHKNKLLSQAGQLSDLPSRLGQSLPGFAKHRCLEGKVEAADRTAVASNPSASASSNAKQNHGEMGGESGVEHMDDSEMEKYDESMDVLANSGNQVLTPSRPKRANPTDLADLEMCIENIVNSLHDEIDGDGEDMIENDEFAWDDVNNIELPIKEVKAARAEEMAHMKGKMFKVVPRSECFARTGRAPISTKWVDTDKSHGQGEMRVRSRWVARDFRTRGERDREDLFCATPPLELLRFLVSRMMTTHEGDQGRSAKCSSLTSRKRTWFLNAQKMHTSSCSGGAMWERQMRKTCPLALRVSTSWTSVGRPLRWSAGQSRIPQRSCESSFVLHCEQDAVVCRPRRRLHIHWIR